MKFVLLNVMVNNIRSFLFLFAACVSVKQLTVKKEKERGAVCSGKLACMKLKLIQSYHPGLELL